MLQCVSLSATYCCVRLLLVPRDPRFSCCIPFDDWWLVTGDWRELHNTYTSTALRRHCTACHWLNRVRKEPQLDRAPAGHRRPSSVLPARQTLFSANTADTPTLLEIGRGWTRKGSVKVGRDTDGWGKVRTHYVHYNFIVHIEQEQDCATSAIALDHVLTTHTWMMSYQVLKCLERPSCEIDY